MLRHKQFSSNRQVFTKCCTKLVLYGRRDKLSIQSNRHQTIGCEYDAKCPEYISDMLKEQDLKNNNTRVTDMNTSSAPKAQHFLLEHAETEVQVRVFNCHTPTSLSNTSKSAFLDNFF